MRKATTVEKKVEQRNDVAHIAAIAVSVLIQIIWIWSLFWRLQEKYVWVNMAVSLFALVLVLFIYGRRVNAAIKMPWIILILVFPVLGVFFYLMVGWNPSIKQMKKRFAAIDSKLKPYLKKNIEEKDALRTWDRRAENIASYLSGTAGYPVYADTDVEYYDDAAKGFAAQMDAIRGAKQFVFMEYHAIEDGESFRPMKELLMQKAAEGVDVRLFYDEFGSAGFINKSFIRQMEAGGVQCRVFNPLVPILNLFMNNRDHRKITAVDGKIGFTGGYNLADEYFNITHPYGQWKDTGIRLEGAAVRTLTVLFLEMWNAIRATDWNDTDFSRFFPEAHSCQGGRGFIQPYADNPMDDKTTGEDVYMHVLGYASEYAYFATPYLIITDEMKKAFELAARRGVDVRLVTPGIPDKKMIYRMTRSYYAGLAMAGVRIYEYTPGFCHCKQCVADDRIATCGTINLDYRSLYHHFENGAVLYGGPAVQDIKADFDALFPQCREVTEEYRYGRNTVLRIGQCLLRLIAPLL